MGRKADREKPIVEGCLFEHDPRFGDHQDIIYREMRNQKTNKKMYYMQCSICGCCGPVAPTLKKAAKRWNMRKVKVYPRDEFERLKSQISDGKEDGTNKTN